MSRNFKMWFLVMLVGAVFAMGFVLFQDCDRSWPEGSLPALLCPAPTDKPSLQ